MLMKLHKHIAVALLGLGAATAVSAATYCGETVTSTNGQHTAALTCSSLGNNMYQFVFESADEFTSYNAAGSNFYMEVNGVGGYHVSEHLQQDGNRLLVVVESSVAPKIYVGAFYVVYADGEAMYNIPTDADFSQTCGGTEVDTEKPVMGEASLVSVTHNAAVIAVAATPADKIASYLVKNADAELGSFTPQDGNITVTGLRPGTAYTLSVAAKKINGLLSDNVAEVSFTTETVSYCSFPIGHGGDPEFGDANGRALVSLYQLNATTVRLTLVPNYQAGATANLDLLYVEAAGAEPAAYTAGADIASGEGVKTLSVDITYTQMPAQCTFTVMWSNPAWDGRWAVTLDNVDVALFCPEDFTALPYVENAAACTKRMENGQLVIIRDGIRYNALGQLIE